jgi:membrane-bound lytic murein transglycosylase B
MVQFQTLWQLVQGAELALAGAELELTGKNERSETAFWKLAVFVFFEQVKNVERGKRMKMQHIPAYCNILQHKGVHAYCLGSLEIH